MTAVYIDIRRTDHGDQQLVTQCTSFDAASTPLNVGYDGWTADHQRRVKIWNWGNESNEDSETNFPGKIARDGLIKVQGDPQTTLYFNLPIARSLLRDLDEALYEDRFNEPIPGEFFR